MSTAFVPRKTPVRPPVTNSETMASAKSMGVWKRILAFHNVASQLKTLTAEGIAMARVVVTKTLPRNGLMPLKNM